MPTAHKTTRPASGGRGGGGGFWLVVALLVAAVGGVYFFAPDLPRSLIGMATGSSHASGQPENEPTVAENISTSTQSKDHQGSGPDVGTVATAPVTTHSEPNPAAVVTKPRFLDMAKAKDYLARAEQEYKAMHWTAAGLAAHKIDGLDVTPQVAVRAKDICNGSVALEKLFLALGEDRDELTRSYDTDPSLVVVVSNGQESLAVPIISLETPTPVSGDPIAEINRQRSTGSVNLLLHARRDFMPATMSADMISEVRPGPLAKILAAKRQELEQRINRLNNGAGASDPLEWYDTGRFAYRNRLDDHVTELLDKALILDPNLVKSVREDKAKVLFANMACQLQAKNHKQAELFMGMIARHYADTDNGRQARLLYDGDTNAMLALAKQAEIDRLAAEEDSRTKRLERARALQDEKLVAKIQKSAEPPPEEPVDTSPESSPPTSSDETAAAKALETGSGLYARAQQLEATDDRNDLYHKAEQYLLQAKTAYAKLVEKDPNNTDLALKLNKASLFWYGAHKCATL